MFSILTLVLLALLAVPVRHHFATARTGFGAAVVALSSPRWAQTVGTAKMLPLLMMARNLPEERPPTRPIRLPFTSSDPLAKHRAVTGLNARVRWYERVWSLLGIAVLVVLMGVLIAVSVGVAFFAARIILELVVG